MEPRLSELTKEIQARQPRDREFLQYMWLLGKHAGRDGLAGAAMEAKRFSQTSPNIERVLMSAVAAGDTTSAGWASELAPYRGLSAGFVENITRLSVLGKIPYVRVPPLTRTLVITSPFSAAWVQAGQPIPFSKAALSQTAIFQEKKVGVIVPFDEELFRVWSAAVEANFRESVTKAVNYMDFALLDPAFGETSQMPASLTNGIAPTQSTGGTDAQIRADLKALLSGFSDFSRVVIVMSPASALHLSQLLTAGNALAFPQMGANGGSIWNIPVVTTTAAAQVGSPGSNFIVAIDGARVLVVDDGIITAEASTAASLQFSDTPSGGPTNTVSLYQTSTRALRLLRYLNYQRASSGAVRWFPTTAY
jgi:HK97 family phage major capsid protein